MMKSYRFLVVMLIFFAMIPAVGISGGIYRYQDETGAYYYTDDNSDLPEAEPAGIDAFYAVPGRDTISPDSPVPQRSAPADNAVANSGSTEAAGGETPSAEQLEAEANRLDRLHRELQAEKAELNSRSIQEMTRRQLNAYEQQVMNLNARIDQYAQEQAAFQQQVNRYNELMASEKAAAAD